ncbi:MAG TPA: hypothetical protein VLB27_11540 [candidate division Zixibacteria bacterium]|nr:hypothetical protein [candidate division Zixibacteria bacterium]
MSETSVTTPTADSGNSLSDNAIQKRSRNCLRPVELAYIRGMCALREGRYDVAHRHLSGYLKLLSEPDPETRIIVQTLALWLAIQRKIGILEREIGS